MTQTLIVVSAGLGKPSSTRLLADRLGTATRRHAEQAGRDVEVRTVELRDHAHAITDNLLTGFASAELAEVQGAVAAADGAVLVTPTFQASFSGLFKSFVDTLEEGVLDGLPVVVAATGGTPRHSLVTEHAMRPLLTYGHAVVVPTSVYAATDDWGAEAGLQERVDRAGEELARAMAAPRRGRRALGVSDAAGDEGDLPDGFVSFEDLLAR